MLLKPAFPVHGTQGLFTGGYQVLVVALPCNTAIPGSAASRGYQVKSAFPCGENSTLP